MTPERWREVKTVLAAALEHERADRQAYLDDVCTEPALRREVESLIAAHEKGDSDFIQQSAIESGALRAGMNLGPYEILALLGVGGMGEVYQAHDNKLGRDVAIKVLPAAFTHDADRLARLQREARILASLNHPNIATIHGLERCGEIHYLIMELIAGQTLADRLVAGRPNVDEALAIGAQIAEGLGAAHERGVIHRDLKPANVKVTPTGQVKILDFGLAKALPKGGELDLSGTPNLSTGRTVEGGILGTPAYMSPEQTRGKDVDKRSDIWAFGCLLYELLAGRQAFRGETVPDVIAAILEQEPDWHALPSATPMNVQNMLRQALQKIPDYRLPDLVNARNVIAVAQRDGRALGPFEDREAAQRRSMELVKTPVHTEVVRRARILKSGLISAILLGIVVAGIASVRDRIPGWLGIKPIPQERRLAVLPFKVVGADASTKAFGDGLTETLTAKLTQLTARHALQVAPASEVRTRQVNSSETAVQELGVNLILAGSLQQSGGMARVSYALIDTKSRRQLRAETITIAAADPFAGEDQIVESVLRMLDVALQPTERQELAARGTQIADAYDFYLQGRGYLQDYDKVENLQNAINLFQRALATDPKYSLAYTGLGQTYWLRYRESKDTQWVQPARDACERAVAFDQRLAPAHVCLGTLASGTGQYEKAVSEFERALEAEPTSDDAYRGLAEAYERLGDLAKAEKTYRRAIELRPHYWASYNWLGAFYYNHSRFADAVAMFNEVIALVPDSFRGYYNLGAALNDEGRYPEAIAALQHSIDIRPVSTGYTNLGNAYFWQGQYAEASRAYSEAIELKEGDYQLWLNLGDGYHWMGGKAPEAVSAYRQAISLAQPRLRVNPKDEYVLGDLAYLHAMLGEKSLAIRYLQQGLRLYPSNPGMLFKAALVNTQFGKVTEALKWLEKAVAAGYSRTIVRDTPNFALLHPDPQFQELVRAK